MSSQVEHVNEPQQDEFEVAQQTLEELLRTARAARQRGATVLFRGLRVRSLHEGLLLAAAGGRWEGLLRLS